MYCEQCKDRAILDLLTLGALCSVLWFCRQSAVQAREAAGEAASRLPPRTLHQGVASEAADPQAPRSLLW